MCSVFIVGDKALHQVLDDARKIAERCTNPADRDQILKTVGDIESMVDALCELRQLGKVRKDEACQLVNLTFCSKKILHAVCKGSSLHSMSSILSDTVFYSLIGIIIYHYMSDKMVFSFT